MSFREDERRIQKDHGAKNFSGLSRLALNRFKADKTTKAGTQGKCLKALWTSITSSSC